MKRNTPARLAAVSVRERNRNAFLGLPTWYVEHFPPMQYEERDFEGFESLDDAEDFARDCLADGEHARIFAESACFAAEGDAPCDCFIPFAADDALWAAAL